MSISDKPLCSSILIVDDKPENLRLLANILKERGYTVRPLRDGRMVMPSALSSHPDLILLDIMMPEMDGYEVCRQLKANSHTAYIPVIFISALDEVADKVKAFSVGGVDYIAKPFQAEEVIARVETHLSIRQLQKELEHAREAAEAANRAKSNFLANMSHEIRTPLSAVMGFLALTLEDKALAPLHCRNLTTAYMAANNLLTIINDILDISKLESGRIELEEQPFDLRQMIQDILRAFEIKSREKALMLSFWIHPDLPRYFMGDSMRIRQILVNLVGNAIKFTKRGYVKLEVREQKSTDSITCLHFSVSDSGIGIPQDRLNKIFEPFTQADGSTSRKYGGTGLGTTISRQLAEFMGGEIWAESEVGKGSTFHFSIYLEPAETLHETKSECTEFHSCRCFKVLLAEDAEENIMLAKIRLEQRGHTVVEARNGLEAVAACERENPDIVLMDVHMPEMDGLQAAKAIRKMANDECLMVNDECLMVNDKCGIPNEKETADNSPLNIHNSSFHIPIIALTASVMKSEQKSCLDAGMDAVVCKPLNFDELFAVMERLVPENRGVRTQLSVSSYHLPDKKLSLTNDNCSLTADKCSLEKLFREILASFEKYNPEASEPLLEQLGRSLSPQQIEPIQRHLDSFNFDKASEETVKLAHDIGIFIE